MPNNGTVSKFQLSPLREGRLLHVDHGAVQVDFNSRPYVRGDRPSRRSAAANSNFNSRPYVRGDKIKGDWQEVVDISTLAPT